MGKVILDMAMSLDGFIGPTPGTYIYPIKEIRKTKEFKKLVKDTGAAVMDMDAYKLAKGDFTNYEYQVPVFVVTEKAPSKIAQGENKKLTFTFVTDGFENAIHKAKAVAKKKNVMIIGLAKAAQQSLKSKQVDEVILRIIPINLGKGIRLFEKLGRKKIEMKITKSQQFATRNDIYFKVKM